MDQHVLTNYFQQFGPVSSINIGSTNTTVYFSNPSIRDQVLQSRHIIYGNEVFLEKEKCMFNQKHLCTLLQINCFSPI